MTTVAQAQCLDAWRGFLDTPDLFQGAVLILFALNSQNGAVNTWQVLLDIPCPKIRAQPDVVPTPEYAIHVVVMARELAAKIRGLVSDLRGRDSTDRQIFHENMRRECHDTPDRTTAAAGVDERNGAAVAVSEKDGLLDLERIENLWQHNER